MTLVQPEGSPAINRPSVSVETALRSRRASGALLTGQTDPARALAPTGEGGHQTAPRKRTQAESSDCQGRLILAPATAATPSVGAHAAPGVAALSDQTTPASFGLLGPAGDS